MAVKVITPISILAAMAVVVGLGGCTTNVASIDPNFGETTRRNMATHIIDPDPDYEGTAVPGGNGERTALMQERYRTDDVEEPERVMTSSEIGEGGGD